MAASLLIFVKNPLPGKTKTRLAQDVGNEMALAMYGQLMDYTRKQALAVGGVDRLLYYSDFVPSDDMWSVGGFDRYCQQGADLGERMYQAFAETHQRNPGRKVIIGSDCPGIRSDLLVDAFAALKEYDCVLGPALDGGYYLFGMRELWQAPFAGIEWSTESVADQTRRRMRENGLSWVELPPLSDVDYLEDWLNYGWALPTPTEGEE